MIYVLGMIMAGVGAGVLIFALTFVTLLLTAIILSVLSFTAAPIIDRVLKD